MFTECDQMITDDFEVDVVSNGWVGWNMLGQEIGHNPFEAIAPGGLEGQLSCRWGEGQDVPTDNVLDLGWAPLAGDSMEAAKQTLVAAGFERIQGEEGEFLALSGVESGQAVDEDGYAEAYLFTGSDVRWAASREYLSYIRPPAD